MQSPSKLLIVGSFMAERKGVYGGIARSCHILMKSSFSDRFNIVTVDSTQITNPPPGLVVRMLLGFKRLFVFIVQLIMQRPSGVVLFTATGMSFVEKSLMAWICRLCGVKSFIFPRGGELIDQTEQSRFMYHLSRVLLKGGDVFLSQGPSWSDFAVRQMGFNPSNVHVVPNWTATEEYLSIGEERDFTVVKKVPRLIFVGWLEAFKGVNELLEAARNLKEKGNSFTLTFVGGGRAEDEALKFVVDNELDSVITFSGWVESDALAGLLRDSDIFVLPSWAEGLPNSMIEAMSAGLAVVVSDVGMISDFVKDSEHALLVSPKASSSLEDALSRLINNAELRNRIAINGYNLAATEFSVENVVRKLGDIIEGEAP